MTRRLYDMLDELSTHHRTKEELDLYYVNARLTTSLKNYYDDLSKDAEYLENREETKLLRKLSKNL